MRLLHQRALVVNTLRHWLSSSGVLEVDTPIAIRAPAPESSIDCPPVALRLEAGAHGPAQRIERFLRSSPELCMKRLLAAGSGAIFQIGAVFRDGDFGPLHRPEFRLLEWYRPGDWQQLFVDAEQMVRRTAAALQLGDRWSFAGKTITLPTGDFRRITVEDAFQLYAGFSILDYVAPGEPEASTEALAHRCRNHGLRPHPGDSWGDLFHRLFLTLVEPALLASGDEPFFLTHYPAPLAALARLSATDPRVAERVELFVGGVELANGFGELTDSTEQRKRFAVEDQGRAHRGSPPYPLASAFLDTLDRMPPSCGMALGLERLLMLLLDATDIDDINPIPWRSA